VCCEHFAKKDLESLYLAYLLWENRQEEISAVGVGAVGGNGELARLDGVALIGGHALART
jgi:hypothetical protein